MEQIKTDLESLKIVKNALKFLTDMKYNITENIYEHWDLVDEEGVTAIEVKRRLFTPSKTIQYCTEGFMLEEKKYNPLRERGNCYYANLFNYNDFGFKVIMLWSIDEIVNPTYLLKDCPSTTDFRNKNYISKKNIFLKLNECTSILIYSETHKKWVIKNSEDTLKFLNRLKNLNN